MWKFTLPSSDKVIKFLKDNRSITFHEEGVPDKVVGPIHALALQLLSKGIFNLGIANENKHFIGTPQLQVKHVVILKGTIVGDDDISGPSLYEEDCWDGLNYL